MSSKSKVILIPWDCDSAVHRAVLSKQREECSWHQEKVEKEWRELQAKGHKCIYWITSDKLSDTAQSINAVPRRVSHQTFIPIGHISIDSLNPEADHLNLDIPSSGVFWIKTFYVSHSVQGQGIGRAAMDEAEKMAAREPLNARTLMLDTVERNDQMREEFALFTYGSLPKDPNQDWYARRGYQVIRTVQNYYRIVDRNGKLWDTKTVFMRKDIA
ncbi:hypothetical protein N7451_004619 [Penicillium sp. IBT 35674x]|nr:hypothetical protein N7451_004619 [Penicillium sp. IBT 35674x]